MKSFSTRAISLLLFLFLHGTVAQNCIADGSLCDTHERCQAWEEEGECIRAKKYMDKHCPASCSGALDAYSSGDCKDMHEHCSIWAGLGECTSKFNAANMKKYCPKACGICGKDETPATSSSGCADSHANCAYWAQEGEW